MIPNAHIWPLGAYIQVRGLYNNFFLNFIIGYAAVSVFVSVVNPIEAIRNSP